MAPLSLGALEHLGACLTTINGRDRCPDEDGAKLISDGLPVRVFAGQVEFGQHAFEPADQFGIALKPWIGAALVKKGLDLVHRYATDTRSY
jgi:hypothetical protein